MSIFNKPLPTGPFVYDSKNLFNGYNNVKKETDNKELFSDDKNICVKDKRDCLDYQNKLENIDNPVKYDADKKIDIENKYSPKEELRKTRMQYFEQLNNKTTPNENISNSLKKTENIENEKISESDLKKKELIIDNNDIKICSKPQFVFSEETKDNFSHTESSFKIDDISIKDCNKESEKFENNNSIDLHEINRYKKILETDLETNMLIIEQLRYIENIKKTKCSECKTFDILELENNEFDIYFDYLLNQIHEVNQENKRLNSIIAILNE